MFIEVWIWNQPWLNTFNMGRNFFLSSWHTLYSSTTTASVWVCSIKDVSACTPTLLTHISCVWWERRAVWQTGHEHLLRAAGVMWATVRKALDQEWFFKADVRKPSWTTLIFPNDPGVWDHKVNFLFCWLSLPLCSATANKFQESCLKHESYFLMNEKFDSNELQCFSTEEKVSKN